MTKTKAGPIVADKSAASRNKSAARLRVVNGRGDLYAASSADGLWIKIGFSTRLADRLKALNADYRQQAPFTLIGSVESDYYAETQLHRMMQPFHLIHIGAGKELYPACPAVRLIVERIIVARKTYDGIELDDLRPFRQWCSAQAKLEQNKAVARVAHAPRIAKLIEAEERYLARIRLRVQAREAARAA